jgi:hypothetical protein
MEFNFNISNKYFFKPKLELPLNGVLSDFDLSDLKLNNIVFHLGMIELISYWKTICPPKIFVRCHSLNQQQIDWWKKLYFNGLGEFFYLNEISVDDESFVEILCEGESLDLYHTILDHKKVLVPIGGGKDSVVSLEVLKKGNFEIIPMMMNPGAASVRTVNNSGFSLEKSLIIKRFLDASLLEMNEQGFLNGHTPFSALLAFSNVLIALVSGVGNIALSNENSANESTVPGTNINHQYSKSFEFESDFDFYVKKYIHADLNYFSFLRPINELRIAELFSRFPHHFESFRSCNVGSKIDKWCGNCPKCLFTYIILSPFISIENMNKIFSKALLNDTSLMSVLKELSGVSEVKPFECVGTVSEVNAALAIFKNKYSENESILLKDDEFNFLENNSDFDEIISEFNLENNLPAKFLQLLKSVIND